jgi:hypothetical protein
VDYPRIFTELRSKDFQGTVTMEIKPEDMPMTRQEILRYLG